MSAEWPATSTVEQGRQRYARGSLYRLGRGVELDRDEALRRLRRAAAKDHHEAQYALSIMLEGGKSGGDGAKASRRWLMAAASEGHQGVHRKLAAVQADPAETRAAERPARLGAETALRCTVARGHADSVWALLAEGHRGPGWTNLLTELIGIAAENGRTIVTRILIGKLPYARDDASLTPAVFVAARNSHFDVVDALVAAGSDVDPRTDEGNTPLMLCAAAAEDGSVRRLLRGGAQVDAVDQEGNTALMLAASAGHD